MTFPSIKSAAVLALIALHALLSVTGSKAADDPRALQLSFEPWSKLCVGANRCFVSLGVKGACVPSGGRFSVHALKGRAISLVVNFGTKRKLEADISVQVDQEQPIHIPIRECYRLGCRGELNIDDDFVERLKRSSTVAMEATTTDHERLTLSFSLAGFARTYDGPGLETPVLELTQEEMRQRAAQFRPLPQCED